MRIVSKDIWKKKSSGCFCVGGGTVSHEHEVCVLYNVLVFLDFLIISVFVSCVLQLPSPLMSVI